MIDIENRVFNTVATALRAEYPGIFVSGDAVAAPKTFPAVTLALVTDTTRLVLDDINIPQVLVHGVRVFPDHDLNV